LRQTFNNLSYYISAGYTYTNAVSLGTDNEDHTEDQLMYIPKIQANGSIVAEYRNLFIMWASGFTGKRYITVDNSGYLPAYTVSNVICGAKIKLNKNLFKLNFRIENLFNSCYQTIAYFPQPGRSYHISVFYEFNIKQ
jgi:vitamin B12 transporter